MTIREFQEWTRQNNSTTGWNAISPLQVLAHLTEELGEVAQSINRIYEYRDDTAERHRLNLGSELVDVMWLLTQLASHYEVDLEAQAQGMVERAESRAPDTFRPQLLAGVEALHADALRAQSSLDTDGTHGSGDSR